MKIGMISSDIMSSLMIFEECLYIFGRRVVCISIEIFIGDFVSGLWDIIVGFWLE